MRHWPEYPKAAKNLETATLDQLLAQIDCLFGRDNLKYGDGIEAVRAEALRQTEIEFRVSENYDGPLH